MEPIIVRVLSMTEREVRALQYILDVCRLKGLHSSATVALGLDVADKAVEKIVATFLHR